MIRSSNSSESAGESVISFIHYQLDGLWLVSIRLDRFYYRKCCEYHGTVRTIYLNLHVIVK